MIALPPDILDEYRVATSAEIRSWSFGALNRVRRTVPRTWQQLRGTLDDQAIFGPTRDFACVCGKFVGVQYENMVCDRCAVKITLTEARRARFGHVELSLPIRHPLGRSSEELQAFPVLPAAFVAAPAGSPLAAAYEDLVTANSSGFAEKIGSVVDLILDALAPALLVAHNWNMQEAETVGRGMALKRVSAAAAGDECCGTCGYPLTGLAVGVCPGCGRRLAS